MSKSYLNLLGQPHGFRAYDLTKLGFVIQMNKARPQRHLLCRRPERNCSTSTGSPVIEACAVSGLGVFETLKIVCKQVIAKTA